MTSVNRTLSEKYFSQKIIHKMCCSDVETSSRHVFLKKLKLNLSQNYSFRKQFIFTAWPSRGLWKYIETKLLTICIEGSVTHNLCYASNYRGIKPNRKHVSSTYPANIYLLKGNNRNTRKRCEICSSLTMKTLDTSLTSFWYFYC